jgi:hypothetical protein
MGDQMAAEMAALRVALGHAQEDAASVEGRRDTEMMMVMEMNEQQEKEVEEMRELRLELVEAEDAAATKRRKFKDGAYEKQAKKAKGEYEQMEMEREYSGWQMQLESGAREEVPAGAKVLYKAWVAGQTKKEKQRQKEEGEMQERMWAVERAEEREEVNTKRMMTQVLMDVKSEMDAMQEKMKWYGGAAAAGAVEGMSTIAWSNKARGEPVLPKRYPVEGYRPEEVWDKIFLGERIVMADAFSLEVQAPLGYGYGEMGEERPKARKKKVRWNAEAGAMVPDEEDEDEDAMSGGGGVGCMEVVDESTVSSGEGNLSMAIAMMSTMRGAVVGPPKLPTKDLPWGRGEAREYWGRVLEWEEVESERRGGGFGMPKKVSDHMGKMLVMEFIGGWRASGLTMLAAIGTEIHKGGCGPGGRYLTMAEIGRVLSEKCGKPSEQYMKQTVEELRRCKRAKNELVHHWYTRWVVAASIVGREWIQWKREAASLGRTKPTEVSMFGTKDQRRKRFLKSVGTSAKVEQMWSLGANGLSPTVMTVEGELWKVKSALVLEWAMAWEQRGWSLDGDLGERVGDGIGAGKKDWGKDDDDGKKKGLKALGDKGRGKDKGGGKGGGEEACWACKGRWHSIDKCPYAGLCLNCLEGGHRALDCTVKTRCRWCMGQGHRVGECKKKAAGEGRDPRAPEYGQKRGLKQMGGAEEEEEGSDDEGSQQVQAGSEEEQDDQVDSDEEEEEDDREEDSERPRAQEKGGGLKQMGEGGDRKEGRGKYYCEFCKAEGHSTERCYRRKAARLDELEAAQGKM